MVFYKDFNCFICGENEESEDKNLFKTSGIFCNLKTKYSGGYNSECFWCDGCVLRNINFSDFYHFFEGCTTIYNVLLNSNESDIIQLTNIILSNKSILQYYPNFFVAAYFETEFTFLKTYLQLLFSNINFNSIYNLNINCENIKNEYKKFEELLHHFIIDDLFCFSTILYAINPIRISNFKELFTELQNQIENEIKNEVNINEKDKFLLLCLTNRFFTKYSYNTIENNNDDLSLKIISTIFNLQSSTPLSNYKFYFTNKNLCFISSLLINTLNDPGNIKFHKFTYNGLEKVQIDNSKISFSLKLVNYFLCKKHSNLSTPYSPYDDPYFEESLKDKTVSYFYDKDLIEFINNTHPLSTYFNYINNSS